jgi:hypothetical protein
VFVGNCVLLDLPEDLGEFGNSSQMSGVLGLTARAWEPDWAGVMSNRSIDARDFDAEVPFVDWMVYLPYKVKGVPPPSFVIDLDGDGTIIVVQPDPFLTGVTECSALIGKVENAIKHAR